MSEVMAKLEDVTDHKGFKNPAKKLILGERIQCPSCQHDFEEGDSAWLSWVTGGVYCKKCGYPSANTRKKEARVATNVKLKFNLPADKESVREDLKADYRANGLEMPDEDELDSLVEKRMESRDSGRDGFLDEARSLNEIVG